MPPAREVKTCERCRSFKRRCDLLRPSCTRCAQAGVRCSFDIHKTVDLSAVYGESGPRSSISKVAVDKVPTTAAPHNGNDSSADAIQRSTSADEDGLDTAPPRADDEEKAVYTITRNLEVVDGRVIRKRKRNCLSCLRCHRLKVKCDKELPCGRCKSSGNGRECYYSYNKGRNEGKYPCATAPTGTNEDESTLLAPWQVQHKVRGSSHWRDLMAKVCSIIKTYVSQYLLTCTDPVAGRSRCTTACGCSTIDCDQCVPGKFHIAREFPIWHTKCCQIPLSRCSRSSD